MKNKYLVSVGNVGNLECATRKDANKTFADYVTLSKENRTRASGESVIMFKGEDIIKEYTGTNQSENE